MDSVLREPAFVEYPWVLPVARAVIGVGFPGMLSRTFSY